MRLISRVNDMFPAITLFDDFVNTMFNESIDSKSRIMPMDIIEYEKEYILKADLPGIKKENLKLTVKANELLIETCLENETVEQKETVIRKERFSGCYQRVVNIPETCDSENISAKLEDGILTLRIPKIEPKPIKKITID
ncbi:MAG: Hsp20/alpha crystallin family protein [Candidatus Cloacimonetes bacterium]|nr:Hsp20/alpha crystallin family protein [Candidatus Cloacimonadota bacterium]